MTATPPTVDPRSYIHMSLIGGHRQAYIDLFGPMFGLSPSVGPIKAGMWWKLVRARRLMFGTLDENLLGFILVAVARSLIGRRTAGLFLHPNSCLESGGKAWVKWLVFALLSRWPLVSVISIIPFELMPGGHNIATYGLHDPQFWDQLEEPPVPDAAAIAAIEAAAAGRPVLAFIGGITHAKAFPRLASLFAASDELRRAIHLVVAGRCYDIEAKEVTAIEALGAQVWNRFVSDEEIAAAYVAADWVWLNYSPGYEQASGIFGRAVQWGRPVLLRHDSRILAGYVDMLDHPAMHLAADDAEAIAQLTAMVHTRGQADTERSAAQSRETCARWKQEFVATLTRAMGE